MTGMANSAIRIHRHGGREEMVWESAPLGPPAADEVRVRHTAIGVNFSDINVRRGGFYPGHHPEFPLVLGNEAAGVIEEVGGSVTEFRVGDRVAYAGMWGQFYEDTGAYAERRNVPAGRLVAIPDSVTDAQAAACLLKGCTASLIVTRAYTPGLDDVVLLHTAASGVGTILCQWARHLGATVIGTAGTREKAAAAEANGCDHVVLYRETDFVAEVERLAPDGVTAVYDGVGKDTFMPSLGCLRPFGTAVNFGNASGPVPPFNIMALAIKSLAVRRVGVTSHIQSTEAFRQVAGELFALVDTGAIVPRIDRELTLQEAAEAHEAVESAATAGSVILVPGP